MRITDIQVDGFGIWSGLHLRDLPDLVVVYGPNEAGKSTLLNFVRTVLYGFSSDRRRFLPPRHGGSPGGSLTVTTSRGGYQITRHLTSNDPSERKERISVNTLDGVRQGSHMLQTLLGGIDEGVCNQVFAVGLRELQQLGALNDSEAAEKLYGLAAGKDRICLFETTRDIARRREELAAEDGRSGRIDQLVADRQRLLAELDAQGPEHNRWRKLQEQYRQLHDQISLWQKRLQQVHHEIGLAETCQLVRTSWERRQWLSQQLHKKRSTKTLAPDDLRQLQQLESQLSQLRTQYESVKSRRHELTGGVDLDEDATDDRPADLEGLLAQGDQIHALEQQQAKLKSQVEELEFELQSQYEQLGWKDLASMPQLTKISPEVLLNLRPAARDMKIRRAVWDEAKQLRQRHLDQAQSIQQSMQRQLRLSGETDLATALERAGTLASHLRRHEQLQGHHQEIGQRLEPLRQQTNHWMGRQLLPLQTLTALGFIFTVGGFLVLNGFGFGFTATPSGYWTMGILGALAMAVAIGIKFLLQDAARYGLESSQRSMDLLRQQKTELVDQLRDLLQHVSTSAGNGVADVKSAQQRLAELEKLLPSQQQHDWAEQQALAAQQESQAAAEYWHEARRRWLAALKTVGITQPLSPKQIKQLAIGDRPVTQLQRQLDGLRRQRGELQSALQDYHRKLSRFLPASDPASHDLAPSRLLEQLRAIAHQRKQQSALTSQLRQQAADLGRQQQSLRGQISDGERQRQKLLQRLGIASDQELQRWLEGQAQSETWQTEFDQLQGQVDAILAGRATVEQIAQAFEQMPTDFDSHRQQLLSRRETCEQRLSQLQQRRDTIQQRFDGLTQQQQLEEKRLDLELIQQQLDDSVREWQALALSSKLLDQVRQGYESERQPETLADASRLFQRFTDGKYRRIWTPINVAELRVDMANGQSLSLDTLSRGTREQVYLSLRLALATTYRERGTYLPMVLDDVLVNFDVGRARAAAKLLIDYAQAGHQVLLFTCHEHIMNIFQENGIEVCQLPNAAATAAQQGKASPPEQITTRPPAAAEERPLPPADEWSENRTSAAALAEDRPWLDELTELESELERLDAEFARGGASPSTTQTVAPRSKRRRRRTDAA